MWSLLVPLTLSAIAYIRVSTGKQFDGNGLDIQLEKIRAYARARGLTIKKIVREVGSGVGEASIVTRAEFQSAVKLAKEKRWPILVADVSRVGRHELTVIDQFNDPSIEIVSVEDGIHIDEAALAARAKQAEKTAKIISRETKASLAVKKKHGVLLGNRTNLGEAQKLGNAANSDRFWKRAEEYLPIVRQIDPEGVKTRREIVDALNELGLKTDRGLPWSPANFRRLHDAIQQVRNGMGKGSPEPELSFEEHQKRDPLWGIFA